MSENNNQDEERLKRLASELIGGGLENLQPLGDFRKRIAKRAKKELGAYLEIPIPFRSLPFRNIVN